MVGRNKRNKQRIAAIINAAESPMTTDAVMDALVARHGPRMLPTMTQLSALLGMYHVRHGDVYQRNPISHLSGPTTKYALWAPGSEAGQSTNKEEE